MQTQRSDEVQSVIDEVRRNSKRGVYRKPLTGLPVTGKVLRSLCEGTRFTNTTPSRCTKKAKVVRVWANHPLFFCSEHAAEWDTLIMKALTGRW